jgi:hypothetical protein
VQGETHFQCGFVFREEQRVVGLKLFGLSYGPAKKTGTALAANGTALWERNPTQGSFPQARKASNVGEL